MPEVPALPQMKNYQVLEPVTLGGKPTGVICLEAEGTSIMGFIDWMWRIARQENALVITRIHGVLVCVDRDDSSSAVAETFRRKWHGKNPLMIQVPDLI